MTRDEALKLRVGKDKVYVVEPKLEELYELTIVRIELESFNLFNSEVRITATSIKKDARVYTHSELFHTELEALQRLSDIHQNHSDLALDKKHAVGAKILKLRSKRSRND